MRRLKNITKKILWSNQQVFIKIFSRISVKNILKFNPSTTTTTTTRSKDSELMMVYYIVFSSCSTPVLQLELSTSTLLPARAEWFLVMERGWGWGGLTFFEDFTERSFIPGAMIKRSHIRFWRSYQWRNEKLGLLVSEDWRVILGALNCQKQHWNYQIVQQE